MSVQVTVHGKPSMPEVSHKSRVTIFRNEEISKCEKILFDIRLAFQTKEGHI